MNENKILLSINEVCELTGWGKTKTREVLKSKGSNFTIKFGNRLMVHKELFLEYLKKCAKYQIDID